MNDLEYNLIHRFNIGDALHRTAARYPTRTAMRYMGNATTYAELDALTNRMARLLEQSGIARGDAVAILALNSPRFAAALFACARIGAALTPVNLMLSPKDIDYVLAKTRAKLLLIDPILAGKTNTDVQRSELDAPLDAFDGSPVERFAASDDAATIIFTSGTTARPKGVVNTHLNWYAAIIAALADGKVHRDQVPLLALPMFHVAGLYLLFSSVVVGAQAVVVPSIRVDWILDAIAREHVDTMSLPATTWVALLETPGIEHVDLSRLKRLAVFQYLPTPAFERWRKLTPQAEWMNYWGQTETTPLGSSTPPEDLGRKLREGPDPIGIPHLPLEVRIVDEAMNDVPQGSVGEFVARGPSITPGYFEDPDANEALCRGGWHHTGDMGYRDEEGFLYFTDRKKDMIKSGGENVSSQEVEEAVAIHPAVAEVAVIGLPDPYWIERVVAAVVLKAGTKATEEELMAHARGRLAGFKTPKQIVILDEFPKNPTGKVLKRVLREQLAGAAAV